MKFRSAAFTDIGKVRQENEDRCLRDEALGVFGIADGIGGLPGGAEAAECAVAAIIEGLKNSANGARDLVAVTHDASIAVQDLGDMINPGYGIGTTLTFGLFEAAAGRVTISHVGDSRGYVWHGGKFSQLTEDHTVENEARRRLAKGERFVGSEQNRNALTRCIGQPGLPEVDVIARNLAPGDRYLFVSDGVTRLVEDEEIAGLLAHPDSPADFARTLVRLAVTRGGYDNASVVVVFVDA